MSGAIWTESGRGNPSPRNPTYSLVSSYPSVPLTPSASRSCGRDSNLLPRVHALATLTRRGASLAKDISAGTGGDWETGMDHGSRGLPSYPLLMRGREAGLPRAVRARDSCGSGAVGRGRRVRAGVGVRARPIDTADSCHWRSPRSCRRPRYAARGDVHTHTSWCDMESLG